ncbi:T9SS type A sorting domain-containing protein [uncultured Chryseobacterium sp.]|uniref:T9SS type A sorting domain-containing protein n=1 Tax=uncultured Chryseobacterium sp. TaxID=259322 RepID=UPI0025FEEA1E|nr:T9SS type A sorting domain-containing protein [uncultured Chryseobacterium sp.]
MKKIFTLIGIISLIGTKAQIVISEIYGGGGSPSLALSHDYLMLKNIGSEPASLHNTTIQYGPADGNFTQYHMLPNITLNSGQSYLIQEGVNVAGRVDLPAPDFIVDEVVYFDGAQNSSGGIDFNNRAGKIALVNGNMQLQDPKNGAVLDFVSYGTMNAVPVFASAANTAFKRVVGNTGTNNVEFVTAPAYPMNSSAGNTAIAITPADPDYSKFNFIVNPFLKENTEIVFSSEIENVKIYDEFGQVVMQSPTKTSYGMSLIELPKGKYTVTGMINKSPVSQQIVKD